MKPDLSTRARFLNAFSTDSQNNLKSFCEVLWGRDSDVYVFMARKAACLFDCLRELKIGDVRGLAVNDRILDMDLSWLKDKRITLVDDCIFSGTTLYRAATRVRSAHCAEIETIGMAVNSETLRPQLLPGNDEWEKLRIVNPVIQASNAACVRQCFDIVRGLSLVPRPYDVDFPQSATAKVGADELDRLLHNGSWRSYDVSSDLQRSHGIFAFTLIPIAAELDIFAKWHGGSTQSISCAKVRMYCSQLKNGSYSIRLVPMVVLPSMANDDVEVALAASSSLEKRAISDMGLSTPSSRYRLLHYLVSHCLLDWFVGRHVPPSQHTTLTDVRRDLMEMSFGPNSWGLYCNLWQERNDVILPRVADIEFGESVRQLPPPTAKIDNPVVTAKELTRPFEWLYESIELPVRLKVFSEGLDSIGPYNDRLNEGLSLGALKSRIASNSIDATTAILLTLDRMIDLGIAVPTIYQFDSACARTFRHGEDAILGPAQERMILAGLQTYMSILGKKTLRGIELQKIIVLLIQVAVRNRDIESFTVDAELPHDAYIVGIKGFLHGAVPVAMSPAEARYENYPYISGSRARPYWLVDRWVNEGYLERTDPLNLASPCYVSKLPKITAGKRAESQMRLYARGLAAGMQTGAIAENKELVVLSSCGEPDHQLRSLSGELVYFADAWKRIQPIIQNYAAQHDYKNARKVLRSGRVDDRYYAAFLAINSGERKYEYYHNGYFKECVENIYNKLQSLESNAGSVWAGASDCWIEMWPETDSTGVRRSTLVDELIARTGQWLHSIGVALRLIDIALIANGIASSQFTPGILRKATSDTLECIARTTDAFKHNKTRPHFLEFLDHVRDDLSNNKYDDIAQWEEESRALIATWIAGSRPILEDIRCVCGAYGEISEMHHYPYAVIIEVEGPADHARELARGAALVSLRDCESASYAYIEAPGGLKEELECIVFQGSRGSAVGAKYCHIAAEEMSRRNIAFRVIQIGSLPYNDSVRRFTGSTQLATDSFWRLVVLIRDMLPPRLSKREICAVTMASRKEMKLEGEKLRDIHSSVAFDDPVAIDIGSDGESVRKALVQRGEYTPRTNFAKVLICTATDTEDDELEKYLVERGIIAPDVVRKRGIYRHVGKIGDSEVAWVRSGMGTEGTDGSALTTIDAIDDLQPDHIISIGIAFGVDSNKQKLGDVLVATEIRPYEKGKYDKTKFEPRGKAIGADPMLLQGARSARRFASGYDLIFGPVLSGEKVVNRKAFKAFLLKHHVTAVGGEMEGAGIANATARRRRGFLLVKGICDWGEGKNNEYQEIAARNSFSFVFEMMQHKLVIKGE